MRDPRQAPSAVWPRPQSETPTGATLSIAQAGFTFTATGAGASSDVITAAFARYPNITFRLGANTQANEVDADAGVTELSVNVKTDNATLSLDTDESYTLVVAAPTSTLTANTVFGALRGLETFAQLVTPGAVGQGYTVAETTITDAPRFHWRGTMIDTARHWYPTSVIKEHIDVLAYSKFNGVSSSHLKAYLALELPHKTVIALVLFLLQCCTGILLTISVRGSTAVPQRLCFAFSTT